MKKRIISFLVFGISIVGKSQTTNTGSPLNFSGYLETYYAYDFDKPADHSRMPYIYSFNKHNEVTLNLGFIKASYEKENVRANLAFMAGTYPNANLASESGVFKNIFEANVGVKISKNKNLWLDAGIFASHIGFESAIGKDCWNLTRSILADNSPYYESGVKLSYTSNNGKWFLSGLLLNGWQRIQRPDGNNSLAIGHQITFKPNEKLTFNSSSFIGNDKPDTVKQIRYFHNFYGIFQLSNTLFLTAGFDIGAEQKAKGSNSYNTWYAPALIMKAKADSKNSISGRVEYYKDKQGVIISTTAPNGFSTWGYSLNYDHLVSNNVMWRIEGRCLQQKEQKTNFLIASSLAISF